MILIKEPGATVSGAAAQHCLFEEAEKGGYIPPFFIKDCYDRVISVPTPSLVNLHTACRTRLVRKVRPSAILKNTLSYNGTTCTTSLCGRQNMVRSLTEIHIAA